MEHRNTGTIKLDESPYLSDTVMKSAINKENVLPNAMIRDVLVANPQSAKSTEILDRINERIDPMTEEMIGEILEGRNVEGALEILEDNLALHMTSKYKSLHRLESYYKHDTLDISGSKDSLIRIWSQETDPSILYKLAFLHLYNIDSINCLSTLDLIPQQINFSQQDQEEYDEYSELMNLLWGLRNGSSALDSLVEEQLISLSSNDSKPGSIARNVLIANGIIDYIEPIYLADNLKSSLVIPENPKKENSNVHRLKVHPNPANEYIIVSYDLTGLTGDFQIIITSSEGKPIIHRSLTGIKNQIIISTVKISSSMYVVNLVKGDRYN